MTPFSVADIRKSFLDFFAARAHTVVESSPLVPGNDPTLMFTNSGMVQFKDVFLGTDRRAYRRAATVQTCLRAGGKHNDLENVGYTARHHTFFEMLGNWSFGDYFKKEAIAWCWQLLTEVYRLPPERLLATVYQEDDEAWAIWTQDIGLPPERVIRIGDNKGARYKSDNFWMMADTGPCGPCSEIFYDHGPEVAGGPPGSPGEDGDRFIEVWNIVFMQFDMDSQGRLTPLPAPCVDTGMGLERLAAILQGVHSNYEIDLFQRLIAAAARATRTQDLRNASLKVIADHIRACAFLVADGVLPANEGRGYVQRRIIRRAVRHGYKLGQKTPFFHTLVADLVQIMGDAYLKIRAQQGHITAVLQAEEARFFETLANGMEILDAALAHEPAQLPGPVAFKLHDTYGFPLDLTQDICRERGLRVDEAGFDAAMAEQKARARAAGKFKMERALEYTGAPTRFTGYEATHAAARVLALYADGQPVQALQPGQSGVVVLDTTPFYAEAGGQVGDSGTLSTPKATFAVQETRKIRADVHAHHGALQADGAPLHVGDAVQAQIDAARRAAIARNHSATHLMHKALRQVLGAHVQQKGSLVDHERTRFDFSHPRPVSEAEIRAVEALVHAENLANVQTRARLMALEDAQTTGAMMLFGEKYGDTVRVVDIGSSTELCGGTHVARTGDIGLFKIIGEGGVASGIRRVEAVTGMAAFEYVQQQQAQLHSAAAALRVPAAQLAERIAATQAHVRALEKERAALQAQLAASQGKDLLAQAQNVGGTQVLAAHIPGADAKTLKNTLGELKTRLGPAAALVLAATDASGKVQLAAAVTAARSGTIHAGELLNFVAAQLGGKGGGNAETAMGGAASAAALPEALAAVPGWVAQRV